MSSSQGQVIVIAVVFMLLPCAVVGLRIWARVLMQPIPGRDYRRFWWDDYTIFMALAMNIACCSVQILAGVHGQLGQHQANTPEGMPILDDPRFLLYEKCKFALNMLTYLGYGFSKASIVLLYLRIFGNSRAFLIGGLVLLGVVVAWTVAFFFASLFQCYPVTALIEPFYGNNCVNGIGLWYTGGATDIVIDFTILLIPLPMIVPLKMAWRKKIAVICMFLTGTLAAASSIARLVVYVQVGHVLEHHFNDETYFTTPVFVWTVIELSLAVISACLPTLRPIYTHVSGLRTAKSSSGKLSSYDKTPRRLTTYRSRLERLPSRESFMELQGEVHIQDGAKDVPSVRRGTSRSSSGTAVGSHDSTLQGHKVEKGVEPV